MISGDQQADVGQEPEGDWVHQVGALHHGRPAAPFLGEPVLRLPDGAEAVLRHGVCARRRAIHQTHRRRSASITPSTSKSEKPLVLSICIRLHILQLCSVVYYIVYSNCIYNTIVLYLIVYFCIVGYTIVYSTIYYNWICCTFNLCQTI